MLNIRTSYGAHYKVNEAGDIIRMDHYKVNEAGDIIRMDQKDFKPSGDWKFLGLRHVKATSNFLRFDQLTPEVIARIPLKYKNGFPQWTIEDLDHGTRRTWGNTHVHGISEIWFD